MVEFTCSNKPGYAIVFQDNGNLIPIETEYLYAYYLKTEGDDFERTHFHG